MSIFTKDLDTGTAPCGWFAAVDAERRNNESMSSYTSKERDAAQTARDLLDLAYAGEIYINYRKTFIAIKIDSPLLKSRAMASEVDDIFGSKGMVKIVTAQGLVYRIMRNSK